MKQNELTNQIKELKRMPVSSMMERARKLGRSLYFAHKKEEKDGRDCGNLFLDWVKECFWGMVVKDTLPLFDSVWDMLHEKGYKKQNPFVYGDADVSLWVEYPKDKNKKVIVSVCHCSMADNNTLIFIQDNINILHHLRYHIVTAWSREVKSRYSNHWGDDRDISKPSLNTYRKRDFKFGYGDGRDKGHILIYDGMLERVENASWTERDIPYALSELKRHLFMLEEDEEQ